MRAALRRAGWSAGFVAALAVAAQAELFRRTLGAGPSYCIASMLMQGLRCAIGVPAPR